MRLLILAYMFSSVCIRWCCRVWGTLFWMELIILCCCWRKHSCRYNRETFGVADRISGHELPAFLVMIYKILVSNLLIEEVERILEIKAHQRVKFRILFLCWNIYLLSLLYFISYFSIKRKKLSNKPLSPLKCLLQSLCSLKLLSSLSLMEVL